MTRKDYVRLAAALKAAKPNQNASADAHDTWRLTVRVVAELLASDNPRFDTQRFLEASGLSGNGSSKP